jgi:hypothetical protein
MTFEWDIQTGESHLRWTHEEENGFKTEADKLGVSLYEYLTRHFPTIVANKFSDVLIESIGEMSEDTE